MDIRQIGRAIRHALGVALRALWRFIHRFQLIRWAILLVLTLILVMSAYFTYEAKTVDMADIKSSLQTKTEIYDHKDNGVGSLYSQKGTYVSLEHISKNVQNAVISTEDRSFWTNPGFDIKGILRSVVSLIINRGSIAGGGSTLTQQLVKNTLLSQKQTFLRKGQEIFMAVQMNRVYTKSEILAMYLNNAYFGNGVWGVEDASELYFGKHASELSVGEGATLAAMLRNPSYYNPIDHMDNAISRRNLVLTLEVEAGHLTSAQADAAKQTTLTLNNNYNEDSTDKYPYYFDAVIEEAESKGFSENDLLNKGYKIYTSLDTNYQDALDQTWANDNNFQNDASDGTKVQASSVAIDPQTGGVRAIEGGRGTHVFLGYNYATQLHRSPGSTLKPLMVYTPALENGYHYDSELSDKKQSFGKNNYSPSNWNGVYQNTVPMYTALANSLNVPAVWLLNKIGVQKGVSSLKRFGITLEKKDQNLAAALGGVSTGVSPLTMARAYAAFANDGKMPQTHFIRKIVDATGTTVYQADTQSKQVMASSVAKEMTSMMMDTYNNGTGASAKPYGYTVAGKTGSTETPKEWNVNGDKDQWAVGYTPDVVVATWTGFAYTTKTHYLQTGDGGNVDSIFKSEMTNLLPETAQTQFNVTSASAKVAATTASSAGTSSGSSSGSVWSDIQDGIQDGVNTVKDKAQEWYNDVQGLFN